MIDKLVKITVNNKEYPMAFNLNVMETIQNEFGSLTSWGKLIEPDNGEEPRLKNVIWTFREFINEGIDMQNDDLQEKRAPLTHKQVGRLITEVGFDKVGDLIRNMAVQKSAESSGEEKN